MTNTAAGVGVRPEYGRIDFSTASISAVHQRIQEMGVQCDLTARTLTVPPGMTLHLTTQPGVDSALQPWLLMTGDIEEYKRWIGRRDGSASANGCWEVPAPWNDRSVSDGSELTAAERADLENAGRIYLFGDSQLVKTYGPVLESLRSPFLAAVYAASRVHIHPGASLIVDGTPAVLLFEHLIIEDGGTLVTYTAAHATFGLVEKRETSGIQ